MQGIALPCFCTNATPTHKCTARHRCPQSWPAQTKIWLWPLVPNDVDMQAAFPYEAAQQLARSFLATLGDMQLQALHRKISGSVPVTCDAQTNMTAHVAQTLSDKAKPQPGDKVMLEESERKRIEDQLLMRAKSPQHFLESLTTPTLRSFIKRVLTDLMADDKLVEGFSRRDLQQTILWRWQKYPDCKVGATGHNNHVHNVMRPCIRASQDA